MDKFGRNYELQVQTLLGNTLTITLPFTIEFDITRNTLTSANVCQIRIYNLSKVNRNQIRRNVNNYGPPFQGIVLRAGYGTNLPIVFTGNISQAWSVREGVNFITQIECFDGGFAFVNGVFDFQFPAGIRQKDVIRTMASTLPNVSLGVIGDFPGTLSRGNSYSGATMDILREITGGAIFIDNGKVNALGTNEYIASFTDVPVINAASGLLQTPVQEQTIVRFDMLFEPSLNVGQKISLQSRTNENFNGDYKVTSVKHRGVISGAVSGSVITTGEFFYTKDLTPVV